MEHAAVVTDGPKRSGGNGWIEGVREEIGYRGALDPISFDISNMETRTRFRKFTFSQTWTVVFGLSFQLGLLLSILAFLALGSFSFFTLALPLMAFSGRS